ncbi:hypothetical protein FUAX_32320 [Fulvitalea axinellae]|uniref:3-deoxy-D-manno-octulosonate 8-phosphate phosphatase (KDO 8-P phosphatase) n=1 Tax=Fulvitalea axinellae TaxID=1182444 RepID=A0AAU9DE97_9BACT|nr:hypothetical protein FUAX_32320 [Fulvitalea axinellae]
MIKDKINAIKLVATDVDGTLTDGGMYYAESGDEFKKFNAKDGMAMKMLMKVGKKVAIISHGHSKEMVHRRARVLGVDMCYVGDKPKVDVLRAWIEPLGLEMHEIAYVGDDVNDIELMKLVGLSVCPSDAVRAVREEADIVLSRGGGEAAFRELVDDYLLRY